MKPVLLSVWLRLRAAWDEIDYANKRILELNTGQVLTPEGERRAARAEIDRLNQLLLHECDGEPVPALGADGL